jgi:ureidoglycolate lyase
MGTDMRRIKIEPLTREAYAPFGWILGEMPDQDRQDSLRLDGEYITFWHERDFQVGVGGVVEFVWVHYKWRGFSIRRFESHRLTEQAMIPMKGAPLVHVVCPPPDDPTVPDIAPDLDRMKAFLLDGSKGVCMRRGCWHEPQNFPVVGSVSALVVTRRSTTMDLLNADHSGVSSTETAVVEIKDLTDVAFELAL